MNEPELAAGLAPTPGYRYARRVGDELYVAGQVPHDSTGRLVGGHDPYCQSAQCLDNLMLLLQVHGFSLDDVQRLVIYVVGQRPGLSAAWKAVTERFSGQVPPATLLGVACLGHEGQLVELDATVSKSRAVQTT
jgi:enamine deaminase RidA (YjgF/YER057c/UK114 family)